MVAQGTCPIEEIRKQAFDGSGRNAEKYQLQQVFEHFEDMVERLLKEKLTDEKLLNFRARRIRELEERNIELESLVEYCKEHH